MFCSVRNGKSWCNAASAWRPAPASWLAAAIGNNNNMGIKERLIDPKSPDRRPRRAAYALPTLFTAGNIFLGFLSILRSFRGSMEAAVGAPGAAQHFAIAAQAIGAAVFLDGLDG